MQFSYYLCTRKAITKAIPEEIFNLLCPEEEARELFYGAIILGSSYMQAYSKTVNSIGRLIRKRKRLGLCLISGFKKERCTALKKLQTPNHGITAYRIEGMIPAGDRCGLRLLKDKFGGSQFDYNYCVGNFTMF